MYLTYSGGPTALIEFGGLRLLTDPTLDPAGGEYQTGPVVLRKIAGPAVEALSLDRIDAVLLSHDHHADNLDNAGRALLRRVARVLTTAAGAERLGSNAVGLGHWESADLTAPDGRRLRITATPARHGLEGGDRGPVIGFVLAFEDEPGNAVYVSGDTVWYQGVEEVARRFAIRTAILFMGAARVAAVGPDALTMTAADGIAVAHAFPHAAIVPLHFEGWEHFSESRADIARAFDAAGLGPRLHWPVPGQRIHVGGQAGPGQSSRSMQ